MKARGLLLLLGLGLALLLAACGGQTGSGGGGGGGGGGGNTITVRQLDAAPLVGAYYRTGGGSWQALSFTGGEATFTASGDYEVAVRCQGSQGGNAADVQLFKASPALTRTVVFACGGGGSGGGSSKQFEVNLPASIGGTSVQSGDLVFVGGSSEVYTGSNPVTLYPSMPDGPQDVLLTVLRPVGSPPTSVTPIGYKLVNLNLTGSGPFAVNATGWQPFSAVRTITLNLPSGFNGGSQVSFFKDGMKEPTIVGGLDRYGTLATSGKYLGLAQARSSGYQDQLFAIKETGGADWNVSFLAPWATGQFSVSGDTLTFNHPQAQAYIFSAYGFLKDSNTNSPLLMVIILYGGGNASYTVPVVPGLSYGLADPDTRSVSFAVNAFQGDPARIWDVQQMFQGGVFSESALAGLDLSWAQRGGGFTGSSYTLP